MTVIGVDGCKAGWFSVELDEDMRCVTRCYASFDDLWSKNSSVDLLLIDIPIGLPNQEQPNRKCDIEARKLLGKPRSSSVFPPPGRAVFQATGYRNACRLSQQEIGKKISRQTWAITPKIREVDEFLRCHSRFRKRIRETHPELAFWALNGRAPMASDKRSSDGHRERLAVLRRFWPGVGAEFVRSRNQFKRNQAAPDDILDAMVAAISAKNDLISIPEAVERDACGLQMEITFASTNLGLGREQTSRLPVGQPLTRAFRSELRPL